MEESKSKHKARNWFSSILILLPRVFIVYPLYLFPSYFAVKFTNTKTRQLFLFSCLLIVNFFISAIFESVSITAFLLSYILQFPFLLFIFQIPIKKGYEGMRILRIINVLAFLFSLINMVQYGFPKLLPYRDFPPDYFSAFFGQGGAKMVTIIGFFGFTAEIFKKKGERNKIVMWIALLNFLIPSYLIGILMGLTSLLLVAVRKNLLIPFLLILIGLIIVPFTIQRLNNINSTFTQTVGYNPKIFAYVSIGEVYNKYPATVFTGTSLGQFTSTPALWASKYFAALSQHEIPNVPGLSMSGYHQKILGPVLSSISDDAWSLSSSANKPYTSVSTVFTEYGLILGTWIVILFIRAFRALGFQKRFVNTIFLFVGFLYFTDLMHDNLWLGYLLILLKDISIDIT
jgi:hypothetical protein